jgi:RimJ/RimL family protein N-acetyltransferase
MPQESPVTGRTSPTDEKPTPTGTVQLRDVADDDLPIFFEHQWDAEATRRAAFPALHRDDFMAHWSRILSDPAIAKQTILLDGQVAGNIVCYRQSGKQQIGYWLGRDYWGKGIATKALAAFLQLVTTRPLYARVAKHNHASIRVLEKGGFVIRGEDNWFSGDNRDEVGEYIFELSGDATTDAP